MALLVQCQLVRAVRRGHGFCTASIDAMNKVRVCLRPPERGSHGDRHARSLLLGLAARCSLTSRTRAHPLAAPSTWRSEQLLLQVHVRR